MFVATFMLCLDGRVREFLVWISMFGSEGADRQGSELHNFLSSHICKD